MSKPDFKNAYAEKLRDPRWQRKRLEILQRDVWTCQVCGSKEKTLHVHHKNYERGADPWDYPNYMLVTLCEPCHEAEGREQQYLFGDLCKSLRDYFLSHEMGDIGFHLDLAMTGGVHPDDARRAMCEALDMLIREQESEGSR